MTDLSRGVGGSSSEDRTHPHTHNITAAQRAREALDGPRFDVWSWDRDGSDLAGTVLGTRYMHDKYAAKRGERIPALEVELVDSSRRTLVYLGSGLRRHVEDQHPRVGDGIAIRRGELIQREPLPSYREWIVEVVPAGQPTLELDGEPSLPPAAPDQTKAPGLAPAHEMWSDIPPPFGMVW